MRFATHLYSSASTSSGSRITKPRPANTQTGIMTSVTLLAQLIPSHTYRLLITTRFVFCIVALYALLNLRYTVIQTFVFHFLSYIVILFRHRVFYQSEITLIEKICLNTFFKWPTNYQCKYALTLLAYAMVPVPSNTRFTIYYDLDFRISHVVVP